MHIIGCVQAWSETTGKTQNPHVISMFVELPVIIHLKLVPPLAKAVCLSLPFFDSFGLTNLYLVKPSLKPPPLYALLNQLHRRLLHYFL
jgi:hypothetical protein